MERLQPTVIGRAAIRGFAKGQHDEISCQDVNSSE